MSFDSHPVDRLVSGVLTGLIVSLTLTLTVNYLASQLLSPAEDNPFLRLGLAAGLGVLLMIAPLVLKRTVLRHRRNIFTLDVDLNQAILGRTLGVIAGLCVGASFAAEWF